MAGIVEVLENETEGLEFFKAIQKRLDESRERLTQSEFERLCKYLDTGDFAIIPENFIFNPGFMVYRIYRERERASEFTADHVLKLYKQQLPEQVTWEQMANIYMRTKNIGLLNLVKLASFGEPQRVESHYEY